jgi:hypothetical protein
MPIEALRRAIVVRKEHDNAPWHALFSAVFGTPGEGSQQAVNTSQDNMTPALFDAIFGLKPET